MNSSIKPKPLIGEILPGFTFLALILYYYFTAHPCELEWILSKGGVITIAVSGLVFILSWIVGDFFDAFREILEVMWDHLSEKHAHESKLIKWIFGEDPLNWDFFFKAKREKADQLEDYYYSYYELGINFAVSIAIFLLAKLLLKFFDSGFLDTVSWKMYLVLLVSMIIFFADALILRKEITKHTNGQEE